MNISLDLRVGTGRRAAPTTDRDRFYAAMFAGDLATLVIREPATALLLALGALALVRRRRR